MNIADLPEDWKTLLEYDKQGNISNCVDLYSLFNRSPVHYVPVSDKERATVINDIIRESEDAPIEEIEDKCSAIEFGYKILNDSEQRKVYNRLYGHFHGAALAKEFFIRAETFAETGNLESAIAQYDRAIKLNPKDSNIVALAYFRKAELLKDSGDTAGAKENFGKSAEKMPENLEALINLAELHKRDNEFEKGIEIYKKILSAGPNFEAYRGIIGCLGEESQAFAKERNDCEKLIKEAVEAEEYQMLEARENNGKEFESIEHLRLNDNERYLCREIDVYTSLNIEKAKARIKLLLKMNPESSEAYYYKSVLDTNSAELITIDKNTRSQRLRAAYSNIETSLEKRPIYSKALKLKKEILSNLIKSNTSLINHYHDCTKEAVENGVSASTALQVYEPEEDLEDRLNLPAIKTSEVLVAEGTAAYENAKDILSMVKRHMLYGYLPAEEQRKLAKENGDSAKNYTDTSIGTEGILGVGAMALGASIFDITLFYLGVGLAGNALLRAVSSKDSDLVVGSPLIVPWKYARQYIENLKKKHQLKAKKKEDKEKFLLEERMDDDLDL